MAESIDAELANALVAFVGQEKVNALRKQNLSKHQIHALRRKVKERQDRDELNEHKIALVQHQTRDYAAARKFRGTYTPP